MAFNKIFVATNLSYVIGMLLVGITLAYLDYGIWSLVIGMLVTNTVISLFFIAVAPIKFSFHFSRESVNGFFRYGLGQTSVEGVNQFSLMVDKLILAKLSTIEFLGLYERSQRIQKMPGVFMGGIFVPVLFSALSKSADSKVKLGKHFFEFLTCALLMGVYVSVLLFTFSEEVVNIVLGNDWMQAVIILKLLAVLISFNLLNRLCDCYIRATGEFNKALKVKLLYLASVLIFISLGFYISKNIGALIGFVLASATHTVLMLLTCQRDCDYPIKALWQRLRPSVVLVILLAIKNSIIIAYTENSVPLKVLLILSTDVLTIATTLLSKRILGEENWQYISARTSEILNIIKAKRGQ